MASAGMGGDQDSGGSADVLLVTVTAVETRAVLDAARNSIGVKSTGVSIGEQLYYDLGSIGCNQTYLVRSEMGSGGPSGSAMTIAEAIEKLAPSAVIMVGIAFGADREEQEIGDILVSTHISGYELQRLGTGADGSLSIVPRGSRIPASPKWLSIFRHAELEWEQSAVRFGVILSGEKLIDNTDFRDLLRRFEPEAVGGEMEGSGLYSVAYRKKVDWMLVKAICDWADGRKRQNQSRDQQLAAANAARFTIAALAQETATPNKAQPPSLSDSVNLSTPGRSGRSYPMPKTKQTFTQKQRDEFLMQSFEVIREYFNQALQALETEQNDVETSFREITSLKFICTLYRSGQQVNQCKIWLGGLMRSDTICYVEGRIDISQDTTMNDYLTVEAHESHLCLKPSGMWFGSGYEAHAALTQEGAAEYLWRRVISRLEYY